MAVPTFAFCRMDGVIDFGKTVPLDAIAMAKGQEQMVRNTICSSAQLSGDKRQFLVPGMVDAEGMGKVSALAAFIEQLADHNRHGFRAIGV